MMQRSLPKSIARAVQRAPEWLFPLLLFTFGLLPAARAEMDVLNPPGKFVDVGGYRLYMHCEGEGTPAVVLDAGLGGLSLEWQPVQQRLKHYTRVCSYDRAGYGWSDAGPEPRSSSVIADELFQLLHNAKVPGPYLLVGHSFGGYNVQMFAERYPYLTAGVVLVESSHPEQVERFEAPPINLKTAPDSGVNAVMILGNAMPVPAHMPEEVQDAALMLMSLRKTRYTVAQEYLYFRDSAAEVRTAGHFPPVPLVVLSRGRPERDTASPQGRLAEDLWLTLQDELAAMSPHSAHLLAKASRHHVHLDQPELVANAVTMVLDFAHARAQELASGVALPQASTWLAFRDAAWRSDHLHAHSDERGLATLLPAARNEPPFAGHLAGTAQPQLQRMSYADNVNAMP